MQADFLTIKELRSFETSGDITSATQNHIRKRLMWEGKVDQLGLIENGG
jgi:hypothetical protein